MIAVDYIKMGLDRMDGHEEWMDEDQINFRTKWKKQHGRMKGANQAYKRHCLRAKAKTLKFMDKWIKEID
tara:strand:+ start:363 stop:572 length:210 start_codon:yes stop_codon:yes gene_type:complete